MWPRIAAWIFPCFNGISFHACHTINYTTRVYYMLPRVYYMLPENVVHANTHWYLACLCHVTMRVIPRVCEVIIELYHSTVIKWLGTDTPNFRRNIHNESCETESYALREFINTKNCLLLCSIALSLNCHTIKIMFVRLCLLKPHCDKQFSLCKPL